MHYYIILKTGWRNIPWEAIFLHGSGVVYFIAIPLYEMNKNEKQKIEMAERWAHIERIHKQELAAEEKVRAQTEKDINEVLKDVSSRWIVKKAEWSGLTFFLRKPRSFEFDGLFFSTKYQSVPKSL